MMAGAAALLAQPQPVISVEGTPPYFKVIQSGILPRLGSPNLPAIFQVRVDKPDAQPLAGDHSVEGGALHFRPKYPLEPGVSYRAVFSLVNEKAEFSYTMPKPAVVATTLVEHVYPSTSKLPENLLKLYLHFSAPMSKGEAFKRIHLVEEGGSEVNLPFLEIAEELWDREFKRLTILFDPGRIKRDLVPNKEVGPPLKAGKKYSLVIDADWKDAKGVPLKAAFRKQFEVEPADRTPLDTANWRLGIPAPGTTDPVAVDFPEPLDSALMRRFIDVVDPSGAVVKGAVTVEQEERRWVFRPAAPWAAGKYNLEVLAGLEDLAGNRVGRAFDVDKFDQVQAQVTPETRSLEFTIGAPVPAPPAPVQPKP